jgi:diguanylate cyclase (GGDEF)-like protein/PAS domain S-box-containing protein
MSEILDNDVFHASPVAFLLLDRQTGAIVQANSAASRLYGSSAVRIEECDREDAEIGLRISRSALNALQEAPEKITTCAMQGRDGMTRAVELHGAIMKRAGRDLLLVALKDAGAAAEPDTANADALKLAALVYQHSDEAMVVTDADGVIISINAAFTRVTGYSEDEAIGRSPSMLRSGRQSAAFYREMWDTLNATGTWRGQLINRRKNGEEYVERLTISTIRDHAGMAQRYVGLFSDITEKARFDSAVWTQANVDALTELPNRRLLLQRVEQHLKDAEGTDKKLALLCIDLDGFKEINDTLGHHTGDQVLIETSARIRACLRTSDLVARTGGDEFAVVLPQLSQLSSVETIGRKIVEAIGAPFLIGAERAYLSASIGIALSPDDARTADALLSTADHAMHAAKQSGRNRYQFFTRALHEKAVKRVRMIAGLREAIEQGHFELVFQPIVNLASGRLMKAEALLRWRHPEQGLISPAEFIPVAESAGLIVQIGDWVFRQAAQWRARWDAIAPEGFQISVNVSPAQFRLDAELPARWIEHCKRLHLAPQSLVIEITEGLLLEASRQSMDRLRAFHDAGMQIALDDFGTGYSGLSYLRSFDIDYIKIDQAFVRDMHKNPADVMLSEAIVAMAHKLGVKVVAEGVEAPAHQQMLTAAGCDFGQGYLFSRPLPASEFEAMLGEHPALATSRARSVAHG